MVAVSYAAAADWPQWGGNPIRNMVGGETGLPITIDRGTSDAPGNVRWTAKLGTNVYGNPTVCDGRVYVGTNGQALDDDRFSSRHVGVLMCLDEKDGSLLWQLAIPKRIHDLPAEHHFVLQNCGVCSSPTVDGDRVYIVSSAAEILCLDVNGLADGNDGPFRDEAQYMAGHGEPPVELKEHDADIIWCYPLIEELGVCPHDAVSCSVLIDGDVLYTNTSNGVGGPPGAPWPEKHSYPVNPKAPEFIALDKRTGKLLAYENEGISQRIWHSEWSSPSLGVVNGRKLVFLGGGDGFCYAFEALTNIPDEPVPLKLAWKYDCNPPEYRFPGGEPVEYYKGDKRQKYSTNKNDGQYVGPSQVIATPVFYDNRVYIAIGQDPAHGRGKGMLHCIDATQSGDVTKTACVWRYDGIERTLATAAVADGLVYIPDLSGKVHCLDADTGEVYWVYDTGAETWGSVLVADGRLYLGNVRYLFTLKAGKETELLAKTRLGAPIYSTAVAANRTLFVATSRGLWVAESQAAK
ncbi:outer membrane protein assembly factor BamB family protein [Thermostilla marina]